MSNFKPASPMMSIVDLSSSLVLEAPRKNTDLLSWALPSVVDGRINNDSFLSDDSLNMSTIQQYEQLAIFSQTYKPKTTQLVNLSTSMSALEQKFHHENTLQESRKEAEIRAKTELEQSKLDLIDSYQRNEENLIKQLSDSKESYETLLKEKDRQWQYQFDLKQQELLEHEHKTQDYINTLIQKHKSNEQSLIEKFNEQENVWSKRLQELEVSNKLQLQSIQDKHNLDAASQLLVNTAHQEAAELKIQHIYDKKSKKIESQLEAVILNFRQKEAIMQGSLDEVRRELLIVQSTFEAKERSLQEEIQLKDKRLIAIQTRLNGLDDYIRIADMWRNTSRDLSTVVIQTCATVQDLPNLPEPPKDNHMNAVFQGFVREEEQQQRKRKLDEHAQYYEQMKHGNVLVQKRLLTRALKTSNKIMERIEAEILPKVIEY